MSRTPRPVVAPALDPVNARVFGLVVVVTGGNVVAVVTVGTVVAGTVVAGVVGGVVVVVV
jgi:heme O synthase-like polyprenyltransferase